ncbi:hypothetical protein GCM10028805_00480 [Spirosoma harenae]
MTFQIITISNQVQWRHFCLRHDDLEATYTFLRRIVQGGDSVVSVTLIDKKGRFPLPLDCLEETTFSNPIESLRQQWEELLAPTVGSHWSRSAISEQFHKLQQDRIGSIRRTLRKTQELQERAQHVLSEGPRKVNLLNHYQGIMDQYSGLLDRLETSSRK